MAKRPCYPIKKEGMTQSSAGQILFSSNSATLPVDSTSGQVISTAEHQIDCSNLPSKSNSVLDQPSNELFPDPSFQPGQDLLQDIPSPLDFSALDLLFSSHIDSDLLKAERLEHLAYFTSSMGMSTFADQETFRWSQKLVADDYQKGMEDGTRASPQSEAWLAKARQLTGDLQEIVKNKRNNDVIKFAWTTTIQVQCQDFFTPANIERFLEYFWSLWYPNCPIIHKPLFNPCSAPTALLCVMTIIGACLSPSKSDVQRARQWLDSAEELIFSHDCFRDTKSDTSDPAWRKARLRSAQAGYLICSLQKREGSAETQARVRRYRHASMVTVSVDLSRIPTFS